jgi:hypothetical protein
MELYGRYQVWMELFGRYQVWMEFYVPISSLGGYFSIIEFKSQSMQMKDIKCLYAWNFVEPFLLRIFTQKSTCLRMICKIPVRKLTNFPMLNLIDSIYYLNSHLFFISRKPKRVPYFKLHDDRNMICNQTFK